MRGNRVRSRPVAHFSLATLQRMRSITSYQSAGRDQAFVVAHGGGACSYRKIAAYVGLHAFGVGKIVRPTIGREGVQIAGETK